MKLLCSLVLFFNLSVIGARDQCTLRVAHDFGVNSPILITNGNFVYPDSKIGGSLSFKKNQVQEAYCPGGFVEVSGANTRANSIRLKCSTGDRFLAPTVSNLFSNISCNPNPVSSTRETGNCPNGRLIEIGFQVTKNQFMRTIDLCYNSNSGRTNWAHSVITGAIRGRHTVCSTPGFRVGRSGYFDEVPVAKAYARNSQRDQVLEIFGRNTTLRDKYIAATGENYFVKGHLVARADMFYTAQQYSTYYYLNAQPMYQSVNNGNWKVVEGLVRHLATNYGDLEVWTGNLYDLNLYYADDEDRTVFLADNTLSRGNPVLTVPRLFFKLVYSQSLNQAIVYITANNPFLTSSKLSKGYKVCREYVACRQNNPQFNNVDKGVTYCCLYNDFARDKQVQAIGVPTIPSTVTPLV